MKGVAPDINFGSFDSACSGNRRQHRYLPINGIAYVENSADLCCCHKTQCIDHFLLQSALCEAVAPPSADPLYKDWVRILRSEWCAVQSCIASVDRTFDFGVLWIAN